MLKVDYKKEFKSLYSGSKGKNTIVEVPEMNYLMIDGKGNPNTSQNFNNAIEVLYSVSYSVKFLSKKLGLDYVVMPLQGLWYADDMYSFSMNNKEEWEWTLMIMQPENITKEMIDEAIEVASKKKKLEDISKLRFDSYSEGLCGQVLHIGPYSEEHTTINKLHNFIGENGYELRGYHHEIYLSDARRVTPEKLKTIIRQPIKSR